jgi:multidrug resistance efflux pump
MSETGGGSETVRQEAEATHVTPPEQGLWKNLGSASDVEASAQAWAPLMFTQLSRAEAVGVFLVDPEGGRMRVAANWPETRIPASTLIGAAEAAIESKRGVVRGGIGDGGELTSGLVSIVTPLIINGVVMGVVGAEIHPKEQAELRVEMRRLQWGAAWLRDVLRDVASETDKTRYSHAIEALNSVVSAAEQSDIATATRATATDLATRFQCDRVSIGFRRMFRTKVTAISNSAQFGKQMNLVRLIGAAMDEAVDQRGVVVWPETDPDAPRATHRHEKLARAQGVGHIATAPLYASGHFVGAILFERAEDNPFSQSEIEIFEAVTTVLAPVLEEKRRNDRWLITKLAESIGRQFVRIVGPGYLGRKAFLLTVAGLSVFFWFAKAHDRIAADAVIEGAVQRTIAAPFDGFIAESFARAGDFVDEGTLLLRLDDRELALERLSLVTQLQREQIEFDRALSERNRAETQVRRSQIEQFEAQIALLDTQTERTRLTAPFDGLITSGDLSQSIGASVARGEAMLTVAPAGDFRITLRVDERRIADVRIGQTGNLVVTALPQQTFPMAVTKITPVAEYADGVTTFRVEAILTGGADNIQPGMEGIGKVDIAEARLIKNWTRPLTDWARLWAWRWLDLG